MGQRGQYSGKVFSEVRLQDLIARGGMGEIYHGHHDVLDIEVAVKVILPNQGDDKEFRERFLREARASLQLTHPNILRVFNATRFNNIYYIVMEFVDGTDVKKILKNHKRIDWRYSLNIVKQACDGLFYAHKQGVIHRDIKPDNIMINRKGLVKIADFGLAMVKSLQSSLTTTGQVLGTPLYMSPEQCQGIQADQRSDIYALGVTWYHMLVGRPPFIGDSPAAVIGQHLQTLPTFPPQFFSEIPVGVKYIISKMMEKEKTRRYQNLDEVLVAIKNIHKSENQKSTDDSLLTGQQQVQHKQSNKPTPSTYLPLLSTDTLEALRQEEVEQFKKINNYRDQQPKPAAQKPVSIRNTIKQAKEEETHWKNVKNLESEKPTTEKTKKPKQPQMSVFGRVFVFFIFGLILALIIAGVVLLPKILELKKDSTAVAPPTKKLSNWFLFTEKDDDGSDDIFKVLEDDKSKISYIFNDNKKIFPIINPQNNHIAYLEKEKDGDYHHIIVKDPYGSERNLTIDEMAQHSSPKGPMQWCQNGNSIFFLDIDQNLNLITYSGMKYVWQTLFFKLDNSTLPVNSFVIAENKIALTTFRENNYELWFCDRFMDQIAENEGKKRFKCAFNEKNNLLLQDEKTLVYPAFNPATTLISLVKEVDENDDEIISINLKGKDENILMKGMSVKILSPITWAAECNQLIFIGRLTKTDGHPKLYTYGHSDVERKIVPAVDTDNEITSYTFYKCPG